MLGDVEICLFVAMLSHSIIVPVFDDTISMTEQVRHHRHAVAHVSHRPLPQVVPLLLQQPDHGLRSCALQSLVELVPCFSNLLLVVSRVLASAPGGGVGTR